MPTLLKQLVFILCVITLNSVPTVNCDGKIKPDKAHKLKLPPCRACKIFTDSFKQGLERTSKFKFEGGDTAWEEKNLGSYANSEVRFVENHEELCSEVIEGKEQCYQLLDEYDEELEIWWSKHQKTEPDLVKYLCIDKFKACCPDLHYGKDCIPCPGYPDQICTNNGKCKGAGTRKGNGKCLCDTGYIGDKCNTCANTYYESYRDDEKVLCSPCHVSCDGKCTKEGPDGCEDCKNGYNQHDERGCVDINECVNGEVSCDGSTFCVNTEGSYKCMQCDRSCASCTGDGPDECIECAPGFVKKHNMCITTKGPDKQVISSFSKYATYLGLCVCTCILLQKNLWLSGCCGVIVALYIGVAEYVTNSPTSDMNDMKEQLTDQLQKAFAQH